MPTTPSSPLAKRALAYIFHLFAATEGSMLLAAYAVETLAFIGRNLGFEAEMHAFRNLLNSHYFPVQSCVALLVGLVGGSRLRDRAALWTWPLPALYLGVRAFSWEGYSIFEDRWKAAYSHFFGSACELPDCLDQWAVTAWFCTSVSYSLGALISMVVMLKTGHRTDSR